MARRTGILLLAVALLGAAVALGVVRLLRHGFSTHDQPTAIEAALARGFRNWAVPAELREARNPLPLTAEVLSDARAHWADHCASCHGNDGRGKTTIGERLYPRAPDMTLPATQQLSDGQLFAMIENGIRLTGMPGWGNGTAASAHGSWSLVHLIRHLPRLTPEELAEMEALNPKTAAEWEAIAAERAFLAGGDPPPAAPAHRGTGHDH